MDANEKRKKKKETEKIDVINEIKNAQITAKRIVQQYKLMKKNKKKHNW